MFAVCIVLLWIYETLITTWDYTGHNLEIACNKLSCIKKMCPDLWFDSCKRPPAVSDPKFLPFGLSRTGDSTVVSNLYKCPCSRLGPKFAYSLYGVFVGLLRQSISMTQTKKLARTTWPETHRPRGIMRGLGTKVEPVEAKNAPYVRVTYSSPQYVSQGEKPHLL